MKVSELIGSLISMKEELGDFPIELVVGPNSDKITVAMWQDEECEVYIKAIDMSQYQCTDDRSEIG